MYQVVFIIVDCLAEHYFDGNKTTKKKMDNFTDNALNNNYIDGRLLGQPPRDNARRPIGLDSNSDQYEYSRHSIEYWPKSQRRPLPVRRGQWRAGSRVLFARAERRNYAHGTQIRLTAARPLIGGTSSSVRSAWALNNFNFRTNAARFPCTIDGQRTIPLKINMDNELDG